MTRDPSHAGSGTTPQSERSRRTSAGLRLALVVAAVVSIAVACQAGPGGWDVAAAAGSPADPVAFADLEAIADLRPFPSLARSGGGTAVLSSVGGSNAANAANLAEVELLACRFDLDRAIRVVIDVAPDRIDWAESAVASLLGGVERLRFETLIVRARESDEASVQSGAPAGGGRADRVMPRGEIRIIDYEGPSMKGPRGVGDTLVVCAGEGSAGVRRGEILSAEIRMRASVLDVLDEVQILDAATWTGALVHELGHALGFQGHPRTGDSILVLEQDRLRRAGRLALAGAVWEDPILAALYRIEIGRSLGRRVLSASSGSWYQKIEKRRLTLGDGLGPAHANVGDRDAQLVWREAGGLRLRLVFPSWREQLARRKPLIAMPSRLTRRRLQLN